MRASPKNAPMDTRHSPRIWNFRRTEIRPRGHTCSGPLLPGSEVGALLGSQGIDADAKGLQLEAGNFLVERLRDRVDARLELPRVAQEIFDAQGLGRAAPVHHSGGRPFCGGEGAERTPSSAADSPSVSTPRSL